MKIVEILWKFVQLKIDWNWLKSRVCANCNMFANTLRWVSLWNFSAIEAFNFELKGKLLLARLMDRKSAILIRKLAMNKKKFSKKTSRFPQQIELHILSSRKCEIWKFTELSLRKSQEYFFFQILFLFKNFLELAKMRKIDFFFILLTETRFDMKNFLTICSKTPKTKGWIYQATIQN